MEKWKDIKGYEGVYQVSDQGRVRGGRFSRVLAPVNNGRGYFRVTLCNGDTRERLYIHRLVADAFIPNPDRKTEVNHIDCNPANNRASNLEWVTSSENTKHAMACGKLVAWNNKSMPVVATSVTTGKQKHFNSIREAERHFGTRHITDVLKGKRSQTAGHTFVYAEGGDACARIENRKS